MKTKEKIFYIIGTILVIFFLSCFIMTKYASDNSTCKFYFTKSTDNSVNIGDTVDVYVKLDNDGVNGICGTIVYDKNLVLTKIVVKGENSEERYINDMAYISCTTRPMESSSNQESIDEVEYQENKYFTFVATTNEDNTIMEQLKENSSVLKLTFSTKNCQAGNEYNISWDNGINSNTNEYKTYAKKDGQSKEIITEGTSIKIAGTSVDKEEQQKQQQEEAERLKQEEAERLKQEEAERLKQEEAERLKQEEAERLKQEEAERLKQEEAERLKQEEAERLKQQQEKSDQQQEQVETNKSQQENQQQIANNSNQNFPQTGSKENKYLIAAVFTLLIMIIVRFRSLKKYKNI